MSRTLRTDETEAKYNAFLEKLDKDICRLCEMETIKEFEYWKVLINEFPCDRVAEKHVLLVTKRHCTEDQLSEEEKNELLQIKGSSYVNSFDYILESTRGAMSIPAHYHLQLFQIKDFS